MADLVALEAACEAADAALAELAVQARAAKLCAANALLRYTMQVTIVDNIVKAQRILVRS